VFEYRRTRRSTARRLLVNKRVIDMRARERPKAAGNCGTQVRGAKRRAGSIPNRKLRRAGTGGKNLRVLALSPTTRTSDQRRLEFSQQEPRTKRTCLFEKDVRKSLKVEDGLDKILRRVSRAILPRSPDPHCGSLSGATSSLSALTFKLTCSGLTRTNVNNARQGTARSGAYEQPRDVLH
jgi:hypothetical protein